MELTKETVVELTKEEAIEVAVNGDLDKMTYEELLSLFAIIGLMENFGDE